MFFGGGGAREEEAEARMLLHSIQVGYLLFEFSLFFLGMEICFGFFDYILNITLLSCCCCHIFQFLLANS